MILRRLLAAVLAICTTTAPSSPRTAPSSSVTATIRLSGPSEAGGAIRWRVESVTSGEARSSEGVAAPPSLAVTVQNALAWGTVYPGAPVRVQTNSVPSGATLGIFKLTGSSIRTSPTVKNQFQCYFGFPTTATSVSPSGSMPVLFLESGYTYGGFNSVPTAPGTAIDLTQYSSAATQYVDRLAGAGDTFYFFIGGKASPSVTQTAASYTTTVSITCSLTGL
ncbi:hypothetical protein BH11GEM1_BH11GEM1_00150 [soil metagenome]